MKKNRNNYNKQKQKKRTGELNYSDKLPIKENFILKQIIKVKDILLLVLIIIAVVLVGLAIYNVNNQYIWFGEEISLLICILGTLIIFITPVIDVKFDRIAN